MNNVYRNLDSWAAAGVLMLNACLTVEAGKANSHADKGWERFTDKVIDIVDKWGGASVKGRSGEASGFGQGVVFLAWGSFAQKRVARLDKVCKPIHPPLLRAKPLFPTIDPVLVD